MKYFLAVDLGASSGRVMLGKLENKQLALEELHRFDNGGIEVCGNLHWDILALFSEIKQGLSIANDRALPIAGIAVDTWGVDFALLDRHGSFLGFPYHHRDSRTDNVFEYAFNQVSRSEYYASTGIQFIPFNTVFQLLAMRHNDDPALSVADRMLLTPNALTYMLCGDISAEQTIASTTQAYNPVRDEWAWDLIDRLKLPRDIFPEIKPPGTVVGTLHESICRELNCPAWPVILTGAHDTASAVAAVPAEENTSWAYLSSGTWSLFGCELDHPLLTDEAREYQFTNEKGVGGKTRFLTNIMGMWLIQQSRAAWRKEGNDYHFDELSEWAQEAEPFRSLINPNHPSFMPPGDMPERIRKFCHDTSQPEPQTPGQVIRCAIDSLVFRYRQTVENLEKVTGETVEVVHLVGGGGKDKLINQCAANALQRPVLVGPTEATSTGNILTQAMAVGEVADLKEMRDIVRNSFSLERYEPRETQLWDEGYRKYQTIC